MAKCASLINFVTGPLEIENNGTSFLTFFDPSQIEGVMAFLLRFVVHTLCLAHLVLCIVEL